MRYRIAHNLRAAGQFNGKRKYLGLHPTAEAASAAYLAELARCK